MPELHGFLPALSPARAALTCLFCSHAETLPASGSRVWCSGHGPWSQTARALVSAVPLNSSVIVGTFLKVSCLSWGITIVPVNIAYHLFPIKKNPHNSTYLLGFFKTMECCSTNERLEYHKR